MQNYQIILQIFFVGLIASKSFIKKPTCIRKPDNPPCRDLIITNRQKSFQNPAIIETGLSDFCKLTVTILKICFKKLKPKKLTFCYFRNFSN